MIQLTAFVASIALMAVVALAFAYVALNASKAPAEYPPLQAKAYSLRAKIFWTLLVAGVLIAVITTLDLPYAATRGQIPDDAVEVDIEGLQWGWQLSTQEAEAGDTVVFHVSSRDVNHGLGVYDPDRVMIGQAQAMPGYINSLRVRLDQPGEYMLLCMEYCGLAHHAMVSTFNVVDAAAN